MIDNIQKLYEIAGVDSVGFNTYTLRDEYPPFTDKKQLELESYIFQLNYGYCHLERHLDANFENNKVKNLFFVWMYRIGDIGYYDEETDESYNDFDIECYNADRKQALAGFVCELWEDLTPEQRKEIKRILE